MLKQIKLREILLFSSLIFYYQRGNLIDMDVDITIDLGDYKVTFWSHNPRAVGNILSHLCKLKH